MRSAFSFEQRQPNDEREHHMNGSRMAPREDGRDVEEPYSSHYDYHQYAREKPPPHQHRGHSGYSGHYHGRYPSSTRPARPLQSVVTSSFSIEDEREDRVGILGRRTLPKMIMAVDRRSEIAQRDDVPTSERDDRFFHPSEYESPRNEMPPAPRASPSERDAFLARSFSSSGSTKGKGSEPLKRSFYHHSRPEDVDTSQQLPADFLPPKRVKLSQGTRPDKIVTARNDSMRSDDWFARTPTWESEEDHYGRFPRAQSFPPQQGWGKHSGPSPSEHGRSGHYSPHGEYSHASPVNETDPSPRSWQQSKSQDWCSPSSRMSSSGPPPYRYWDSPHHRREPQEWGPPQSRDYQDSERQYYHPPQRQSSYQSSSRLEGKMQLVVDAAAASSDPIMMDSEYDKPEKDPNVLLLALPQDRVALSETLCVVRENIEVFCATQADVDAPAPGRKHAVVVGQVGLRCIHCRHTTKCSDRVKRAVCYPSSIKRIYRTVIDMKLDHFSQCKFVPDSLKNRLQQLRAVQTRSTGTTMQYFIRAAQALGMVDGKPGTSGVRLVDPPKSAEDVISPLAAHTPKAEPKPPTGNVIIQRNDSISNGSNSSLEHSAASKRSDSMMSTESFDSASSPHSIVNLDHYYEGCVPLALPEDRTALSPLRCFLREQVCAFSATPEDIAVRAPTTFSICVGQVGIGCIHCVKQPAKLRSNRAVCFPFSIGRIYQSVADIQRFHFTECKMLPPEVKERFMRLQSLSSKGSKGLATRNYWVTSAKKLGLVDTQKGIRFGRDPETPEPSKAFSLDILAAAAFTVTTANKQIVLPEDKPHIAEFLYVVMEQLQPCRFTEADRNKRRLKDVGCIGVECKHCAGQVDSRKFFWSSVNAVESNFVSVHTHMLECKMIPEELKNRLVELKQLRKEQTAALKTGSQKAFFARVWQRLHDEEVARQSAEGLTILPSENRVAPTQLIVAHSLSKESDMESTEDMKPAPLAEEKIEVDSPPAVEDHGESSEAANQAITPPHTSPTITAESAPLPPPSPMATDSIDEEEGLESKTEAV